uniref:Glycerol-3-phosphate dehydrogenase [NAD(+)] n=1 Tax=Lotharella oceanica TaxID=641309 RepID=A0A7S2TG28_9EUKA
MSDTKQATKIAVLGAGSYGTAMAYVATHNGHSVMIYARNKDVVDGINKNHVNPKRFTDVKLPDSITASTDIKEVVKDAACVIHAVPAQHTPDFVEKYKDAFVKGVPLVSTAKGIHVKTHRLMSEAIPAALGERKEEIPLVYLSGPSFAKEMVKGHPMAVVVAAKELKMAQQVQKLLSSIRFRCYASNDVIGVEVGGALKNPLAIGAGMARGLGFGQSTIAGLVTRGCREMRQLAIALGGKPETLAGLSGVGDLMLTCFSSLSRNNRCGMALAKGKTVEEAFDEIGEVVEGVPTSKEVVRLAEIHKLELPLFRAVDLILSGKVKPEKALRLIMGRDLGTEEFH